MDKTWKAVHSAPSLQTNNLFQGFQALVYTISTTRCLSRCEGLGGAPTNQSVANGHTSTTQQTNKQKITTATLSYRTALQQYRTAVLQHTLVVYSLRHGPCLRLYTYFTATPIILLHYFGTQVDSTRILQNLKIV